MKNKNIFLMISIAIIFLSFLSHEFAHQSIYESYGIKGDIIFKFDEISFQPESKCPTEECKFANNLNEIVGYNLAPLLILFIAGFYFSIKD